MIKLIDLTKVYKGVRAVDRINLEVSSGTLFGFLGPNGAGKTTTLKMMAGVLRPTQGRILINGLDLAQDPSGVKQMIGFIPDRPYVYEKLSGREFLEFIAGIYGMGSSPGLGQEIAGLLDCFDLRPWQEELIESYSHGMKQRLVMCAALVHHPRVLIVDEPMVGLDPKGVRLVKDLFRQKVREGATVFMSTHSLQVAEEVCQEIAIIHLGRIIAMGSPDDLRRKAGMQGNLEEVFLKLTEEVLGDDPLSTP